MPVPVVRDDSVVIRGAPPEISASDGIEFVIRVDRRTELKSKNRPITFTPKRCAGADVDLRGAGRRAAIERESQDDDEREDADGGDLAIADELSDVREELAHEGVKKLVIALRRDPSIPGVSAGTAVSVDMFAATAINEAISGVNN